MSPKFRSQTPVSIHTEGRALNALLCRIMTLERYLSNGTWSQYSAVCGSQTRARSAIEKVVQNFSDTTVEEHSRSPVCVCVS